MYNVERTNEHFKADPGAGGYALPAERVGSSSKAARPRREGEERKPKPKAGGGDGVDEEDEIKKAIELSKVTAQKEEECRLKDLHTKSSKT
jgi:hypothetical protein